MLWHVDQYSGHENIKERLIRIRRLGLKPAPDEDCYHFITRPFLTSAYRVRKFIREHALADKPHLLAKTYVILLACTHG